MEYWAKRLAESQNTYSSKSIKETEKQLSKYYKRAMDSTITDFENVLNKLLAQAKNEVEPTPADLYKLDNYWQMQAQLQERLQSLGDKEVALLGKKFKSTYEGIYNLISLPSEGSFHTVSAQNASQLIQAVWCADGKSWSQRVWENTGKLKEELNNELLNCVITGKKSSELKKQLVDRFGVSYGRADTVVRTEITHIQTVAASNRYKDGGCQYYEVLVSPDERTCEECAQFDGERFRLDEMEVGVNAPPFHPNCRDTIIPVIGE